VTGGDRPQAGALSAPAVSLAFFDPARERYGFVRAGATLLFEGTRPEAVAEGPALTRDERGRMRAELPGRLELELEPVSEAAELDGSELRVCRVSGRVGGRRVEGLGTLGETRTPPDWDELDALRALSVLIDERHAVLALAQRPRGAPGHGHELVSAWLLRDGELTSVERARISTVYDGEGRQRSAGLELWLPDEDFPRRAAGTVAAGSSLELGGSAAAEEARPPAPGFAGAPAGPATAAAPRLTVHEAVFQWTMEGRQGAGEYQLVVRERPLAAA
jgi:hypothetical protein